MPLAGNSYTGRGNREPEGKEKVPWTVFLGVVGDLAVPGCRQDNESPTNGGALFDGPNLGDVNVTLRQWPTPGRCVRLLLPNMILSSVPFRLNERFPSETANELRQSVLELQNAVGVCRRII